jgi:hypothetical protein
MSTPANELHANLSPQEFEKLLSELLGRMEFRDVLLTGRSGDEGIDLTATWTQTQVPGLEVDLNFIIQAKRFKPDSTLNPRYVRELKGSMSGGQWGLLITTARVSPQTREEGLKDPSRIVSVIDGKGLVALCVKYGVGFKTEYRLDKSFLEPKAPVEEPPEPLPSMQVPSDLAEILKKTLGESFERVGRSSLYKSPSKTVVARWSQRYPRKDQNYWYGLTSKDIDAIEGYGVTHYAYVCGNAGTILIPVSQMLTHIKEGQLGRTPREGELRHYHIAFSDLNGRYTWLLKEGKKQDTQEFFHQNPQ